MKTKVLRFLLVIALLGTLFPAAALGADPGIDESAYVQVFHDDFADMDNWDGGGYNSYVIDNGTLRSDSHNGDNAARLKKSLTDFMVIFQAAFTSKDGSEPGDQRFGISVVDPLNKEADLNKSGPLFLDTAEGDRSFWGWREGGYEQVKPLLDAPGTAVKIEKGLDKWYTFKLIVEGDNMYVYLKGPDDADFTYYGYKPGLQQGERTILFYQNNMIPNIKDFHLYEKTTEHEASNSTSFYINYATSPQEITSLTTGTVTAQSVIQAGAEDITGSLVVALYQDDKLLDIATGDSFQVSAGNKETVTTDLTVSAAESGYALKAFLWDMEHGLVPLGPAAELLP